MQLFVLELFTLILLVGAGFFIFCSSECFSCYHHWLTIKEKFEAIGGGIIFILLAIISLIVAQVVFDYIN